MNIYKSSSTPVSEGSGKVYVFPHADKFLFVRFTQQLVQSVDILERSSITSTTDECSYFDLGTNFNLLPKLSEEMVNESALIEFMNWNSDQKVYKQFESNHNVEVQFQPETIPNVAISHALPSITKHHFVELLLTVSKGNGVHAVIYMNRLFICVVENGQLNLCNTYNVKTDEEVLYYLLLVYQELGLSQEEHPIYFLGRFPENGELTKEYLSTYIRNVTLKTFDSIESNYQGLIQLLTTYHENH